MTEKVRIRLDRQFRLEIAADDPKSGSGFEPVGQIQELSPYGMLLAGVGSCTTMVVMTYAENHGLPLEQVEIEMVYERDFDEDCERCEEIEEYEEFILETISLQGELSVETADKLRTIAHRCPLEVMLGHGVKVVHLND